MGIETTYCLTRETAMDVLNEKLLKNLKNLSDSDLGELLYYVRSSPYRNYIILSPDIFDKNDQLLYGKHVIHSPEDF